MAGYFSNTYVSSAGIIGYDKISVGSFHCGSREFFLGKFVSEAFGVGNLRDVGWA